ncbi:MAG: hypothetical protein AAF541_23620 [Pseudomonadota bacterium]
MTLLALFKGKYGVVDRPARSLMLALLLALPFQGFASPEHAARHGLEGLWTYNKHSQLPDDCDALGQRKYPIHTEGKSETKILEERFIQHTLTAQELSANYSVASQDMSFVEYFRCKSE